MLSMQTIFNEVWIPPSVSDDIIRLVRFFVCFHQERVHHIPTETSLLRGDKWSNFLWTNL